VRDDAFEVVPPWQPTLSRRWRACFDLGSATVVAIVFALVLATFRDYGITWDEDWHIEYGDQILSWFLTFGADTSALCYRVDFLYGGGFDLLGAIARRFSPLPEHQTMHLLGGLVGVLGLVGAWRLATRLGGPAAGFVAVLLLATTPVYYGHMFANPKDLPFAVGYVWALDALIEVVLRMPRVPRGAWIRFAVFTGLAMGVRIAGILVLVYLGAVVLGMAWLRMRATGGDLQAGLRTARRLGRPALLAMAGAWLVMVSTWPWALLDPIRRPWIALGRMSRFTLHDRKMLFAGETMRTTEPRWDYLAHYFMLTIPLVTLALVLVAVVLVARAVWRGDFSLHRRNASLVLAAAIMAPPTYAILMRSVVYDGLRHFLFVVPMLVVVAALGAVSLPRVMPSRAQLVAAALAIGGGAYVTKTITDMRALHPNQYIYFNELIGGMPGAFGKYDTEYYGGVYDEGFATLAEHLWATEPERFTNTSYVVTGCIPGFVAQHYMRSNFVWVDERNSEGAEFYLGYTRSRCHERRSSAPEIFRVERMGTPLLVARDLRAIDGADASEPEEDGR
jgi:hypothetical protein